MTEEQRPYPRIVSASIVYDNGNVLEVLRKKGGNRYAWHLWDSWDSDEVIAKGEERDLIAENPDVAGVVQAMTGAAAMHVKAWKGGRR